METLFYFIISLFAILISCIIFSNSVEWLGARLNLSHGITGSILAAVGTALPETVVPLVAIFWGINKENLVKVLTGHADSLNSVNQISMGAIIGAPFMLSTVAFFLIGFSSWTYFKTGRRKSKIINMDKTVLERDLTFFIVSFSLAFLAIFLSHLFHVIFAVLMLILYAVYLYLTIKEESNNEYKGEELEENLDPFLLTKIIPALKPTMFLIWLQLIVSLALLIFSAHYFVEVIKEVSSQLLLPAFVISLLLTPIATELPEKFNSWMWIRQKKDTLAVGNISGALVFQSTFPVTIGLLFTSWQVQSSISYLIFIFCLICASIVLFALKKNKLSYKTFLFCGVFYLIYLTLVFCRCR
ncbi:MAG: sodium:calcium antiporter [Candidatus Melainabacteria bacterium]|nr:sodium:calcium antiporter [Candidatus Melainabacteria bacterium]